MKVDLRSEHHHAIQERDDEIRGTHFENLDLGNEKQAKEQDIAAFQRWYLENKDKNNCMTITAKSNGEAKYADSMSIGIIRLECCWHVNKVAPHMQVEIRQVPLSFITSGGSIDWL